MKTSEIKELTNKEILEKLQTEKDSLLRMKMNHAISPLENPLQIKVARRNIARLKTILRQREINEKQS
ncbi:MAG: 50S ribosomal protein L29 [Bacteroidetes bacterium GWF2_42_66]|nr:MAG: 50S ribosomal protein L29 [Bacteroidetes bacterium GWA2_42_15]OFX99611.1 MAG: 50S ribosomal protein L29 [Bacteroidetes bacterium GWE2_42_39]OFY39570.1 MAG: 50S ribosomal protein L29 [Bacteroidetes bacterium GWF2_42_66]HBL73641.1 50S ribosomal protein L29 [Prolixibacteraceae bacterium]HCR89098.1 50S ribosomal protein L29 [Prolixibacteraceae bacterium]